MYASYGVSMETHKGFTLSFSWPFVRRVSVRLERPWTDDEIQKEWKTISLSVDGKTAAERHSEWFDLMKIRNHPMPTEDERRQARLAGGWVGGRQTTDKWKTA